MTNKIYIGNLPFTTEEAEVRRLCAPFGDVKSVTMITERDTGRFRGFCFVEMEKSAAAKAIDALDGKDVSGRKIRVSKARSRNKGKGRSKGRGQPDKSDSRPLHERIQRGGLGAHGDRFPHSGGTRGRRSRKKDDRDGGDSDFPFSGGNVRGNR